MLRTGRVYEAYSGLRTFAHPVTPTLGTEKSLQTKPAQLYQQCETDTTGTAAVLSHAGRVTGWQGLVPPPQSSVGGPHGNPGFVAQTFGRGSQLGGWAAVPWGCPGPQERTCPVGTAADKLPVLEAGWTRSACDGAVVWLRPLFPPSFADLAALTGLTP